MQKPGVRRMKNSQISMAIQVKVISPFPLRGVDTDGTVELPDNTRVRDLLRRSLPAALYARIVPVSVNGRQVPPSHRLQDGDLVVIIMPISGG
jgi:sulfur carrier protein ThiS